MLIYTGGGYGGSLPNIPSRDLTDDEVKRFGEQMLLDSGLYKKPEEIKHKVHDGVKHERD